MAVTKLTQGMRDRVLNALLSHKFDGPLKEVADRFERIGDLAYEESYTEEEVKLMESLPDDFLPLAHNVRIRYPERAEDVARLHEADPDEEEEEDDIDYDTATLPLSRVRRIAAHRPYLTLDPDHPIVRSYLDNKKRNDDLQNEKRDVKRKADAVLRSASTYSSLLQKWPEIEPFAKRVLEHTPRTAPLPVPTVAELNKALDLPI